MKRVDWLFDEEIEMKINRKEIAKALRHSCLSFVDADENRGMIIHEEMNSIDIVNEFERLSQEIIRTKSRNFSVGIDKITRGKSIIKTSLGERILCAFKMDVITLYEHFPRHRLNPFVDIFIRHMERNNGYELAQMPMCSLLNNPLQVCPLDQLVEQLNRIINDIRAEANSSDFKTRIKAHQRLVNKNFKSLLAYFDYLFDNRSRLMVLRVDLHYKEDTSAKITYGQAKKDLARLLANRRSNKIFDELVGYVWKLEYGLKRGYHFHTIWFFKGSEVQQDIVYARRIGEYWQEIITKGTGTYYNCNRHKQNYQSCGIGMIDHADTKACEGLVKAAIYMTKTDYFVTLDCPEGGKSFGKGERPAAKAQQGRPREKVGMPFSGYRLEVRTP